MEDQIVKDMAKQLEAEAALNPIADDNVPVFRVTQAPGFMTGLTQHPVGSGIRWEKPEGWNEAKWGKHFSDFGPSMTFEPVNAAAKKRMATHKDHVAKKNAPVPTEMAAMIAQNKAQSDQVMELLKAQMEANALLRRQLDAKDAEVEEAKSKKK